MNLINIMDIVDGNVPQLYGSEVIDRKPWHDASGTVFDFSKEVHMKNGYGLSVIKFKQASTYEVAVVSYDGVTPRGERGIEGWHLDYTTEITDDVIGGLDEEGVVDIMVKVAKLGGNKIEN